MNKPYERYGPEWEKEMMKLTKKVLIEMLRREYIAKEQKYKLVILVVKLGIKNLIKNI